MLDLFIALSTAASPCGQDSIALQGAGHMVARACSKQPLASTNLLEEALQIIEAEIPCAVPERPTKCIKGKEHYIERFRMLVGDVHPLTREPSAKPGLLVELAACLPDTSARPVLVSRATLLLRHAEWLIASHRPRAGSPQHRCELEGEVARVVFPVLMSAAEDLGAARTIAESAADDPSRRAESELKERLARLTAGVEKQASAVCEEEDPIEP